MTELSRAQMVLSENEIRLIKGLLEHKELLGLNQQRIIAHFSFPERTLSHNIVSAIARNKAGTNDTDYPAADLTNCRYFLKNCSGERNEHERVVSIAGTPYSLLNVLEFGYRFHPVGQGLFCSGHLKRVGQRPFYWVYDCGTEAGKRSSKRAQHVRDEIDALKCELRADHLDLVTLSHFDEDHLSGMLDLLNKFSVGTFLLPHLTPWERLIIAITNRAAAGSDLMKFLTAPTAFLMERAEGRIESILLVPSSAGGQAEDPLTPTDTSASRDEPEESPRLKFEGQDPDTEDSTDGLGADTGLSDPRVRVLKVGGSILISQAWEFVPYNDIRLKSSATCKFRKRARLFAEKFRQASNEKGRAAALENLTALYDKTFKSQKAKKISAFRRNEISLFLYAGPIGRVELLSAKVTIPRHDMSPHIGQMPEGWLNTDRFGQVLTGDGFLDTCKRLKDFVQFYRVGNRLKRGGVFQVMHHGSEKNWQSGIASLIQPAVSIYCSNPLGRWEHPGAQVKQDFACYHPVQVDGVHGWQVEGIYRFL